MLALKRLLLDENTVPEDYVHCALRCHTQTGSVDRSRNRSNLVRFFWGEGSLLSDGEHLDNCHQPTVYRYYYRPTTSNIATVKQHKIKNSVANSLAVISTSFPRDLLLTLNVCHFALKRGWCCLFTNGDCDGYFLGPKGAF